MWNWSPRRAPGVIRALADGHCEQPWCRRELGRGRVTASLDALLGAMRKLGIRRALGSAGSPMPVTQDSRSIVVRPSRRVALPSQAPGPVPAKCALRPTYTLHECPLAASHQANGAKVIAPGGRQPLSADVPWHAPGGHGKLECACEITRPIPINDVAGNCNTTFLCCSVRRP